MAASARVRMLVSKPTGEKAEACELQDLKGTVASVIVIASQEQIPLVSVIRR